MFTLTASSCGHVLIKDQEICADLGDEGAHCAHTLTTETRDVEKAQWDIERQDMICTLTDNYVDWKAIEAQLCHQSNLCDYETQKKADEFFLKLNDLNALQKMRKP